MKKILYILICYFAFIVSAKALNDSTLIKKSLQEFVEFVNLNESKHPNQRNYFFLNNAYIQKRSSNDGNLEAFVDENFDKYNELKNTLNSFNNTYDPNNFSLYIFYGRFFLSYEELLRGGNGQFSDDGDITQGDFLENIKNFRKNKPTENISTYKALQEAETAIFNANPNKRILIIFLTESYYVKRDTDASPFQTVVKKKYTANRSHLKTLERYGLKGWKRKDYINPSNPAQANVKELLSLVIDGAEKLNKVKNQAIEDGEWCERCPSESTANAFDMYADPRGNDGYDIYMFFEIDHGGVWIKVESLVNFNENKKAWYSTGENLDMDKQSVSLQDILKETEEELIKADLSTVRFYYGDAYAQSLNIDKHYYRLRAQWAVIESLKDGFKNIGWVGWIPFVGSATEGYYSWKLSEQLPVRLGKVTEQWKAAFSLGMALTDVDVVRSVVKTTYRRALTAKQLSKIVPKKQVWNKKELLQQLWSKITVAKKDKIITFDGEGLGKGTHIKLNKDGFLTATLKITEESWKGKGLGGKMFDEAIKHFGTDKVKGIKGVWLKSEAIRDNYDEFIKVYKAELDNIEEAAFATPTGKIARNNGYTKVVRKSPPEKTEEIIIEFTKTEVYSNNIDDLFSSIVNEEHFQVFRTLCKRNSKISVELTDANWETFVNDLKQNYSIAKKRNISKFEFDDKNILIASGEGYNNQMRQSGKFINEEFIAKVKKGERVFEPALATRHLDTESIALEYFAHLKGAVKGKKYPNIVGDIKITSDLCPCHSCSAIFQQFCDMFPNVKIKIVTTPKLHY
ncbi:MAG: hypothetical protein MUC49_21005 [Raineya sp.]|jgi:hypothetical protein|nr:hypothetical protein [Raineya sp.]